MKAKESNERELEEEMRDATDEEEGRRNERDVNERMPVLLKRESGDGDEPKEEETERDATTTPAVPRVIEVNVQLERTARD